MKILTLDIATCCGWAFGPAGSPPASGSLWFTKTGRKSKQPISDAAKFWHAIRYAQRIATEYQPDIVFYEAPVAPNAMPDETQKSTFETLYGLPACIRGMLHGLGIYDVREKHPSSIRKHFIGHGGLKGDVAKPKVWSKCLELGWIAIDDDDTSYDRTDALALWSLAEHIVAPKLAQPVDPLFLAATRRGAA